MAGALASLLLEHGLQRRGELLHDGLALADNHTVPECPELPQDSHIGLHLECGAVPVDLPEGQGEIHFHMAAGHTILASCLRQKSLGVQALQNVNIQWYIEPKWTDLFLDSGFVVRVWFKRFHSLAP